MLQRFINWIRGVIARMFHIDDAKRTLGTDIAISQKMQEAIDLWSAMFLDSAPWLTDDVDWLTDLHHDHVVRIGHH